MNKMKRVDSRRLSPELQLMLACITAAGERRTTVGLPDAFRRHFEVDGNHFLELCLFHRVYPLVHRTLSGLDEADVPVPPSVVKQLALQTRSNGLKMRQMTAELERVANRFQELDIRYMLLKGPALATELYGEVSLRPSKDLDLLVREEDVPGADEVLRQLGYEGNLPPNRLAYEMAMRRMNHFVYENKARRLCVEIHWKATREIRRTASFDELWNRGRTVHLSGLPVRCFGDEDVFVHLISHGAKHGWFRLRWLADIDRLLRRQPDGQAWFEKATEARMLPLLGQTVLLCRGLLGSPIPAPFESAVDGRAAGLACQAIRFIASLNDRDETNIFGREYYRLKRYTYSIHTTPGDKARYVLQHFCPSPDEMALLPLPASLGGLYPPLRPMLWLWNHARRRRVKPEGGPS